MQLLSAAFARARRPRALCRSAAPGYTDVVPRIGTAFKDMRLKQQWWTVLTDWIAPDQALVRSLVEASAAKYAQEKGITLRACP